MLALAAALGPGCTCSPGGLPPEISKDFGDVSAPPPDALPYLALARATLEHRAPGTPAPSSSPGRRVILSFWRPGLDPIATTATGVTFAEAVTRAAEALAPKVPDAKAGRLEIDVPTQVEGLSLAGEIEATPLAIGLEGVLAARDDGVTGFVLPTEVVQKRMSVTRGLDRNKVRPLVASRAGQSELALDDMRAYRFRVDAHVESANGDAALPVVRGMVFRPQPATADSLLAAVRHAADYLVRVQGRDGRYQYLGHPIDDRADPSYGWLRHSGTTYAIFEAYEEFGAAEYAERGDLALQALKGHLVDDPLSGGKYQLDTTDEEQEKTGGAALALLAFAKQAATTGKRTEMDTMRALARFIMKQQLPDGHFRCNADLESHGVEKLKKEPFYYPGEGTLSLLRLYAMDPRPEYLDVARKAADWVIRVRDAASTEDNQVADHWMSYAMNELYRVTRDDRYLQHAHKIARAIEKKQRTDTAYPDVVGGFFEGQSTGDSGARLEALSAAIALTRFAGKPDDWIVGPARAAGAWLMNQQYDLDNDFWSKNPAKYVGAVREGLFNEDARIDSVQHTMCGWLHLARALRDPAYGTTGVPSQDPVRE